jgi:hypothetical protein
METGKEKGLSHLTIFLLQHFLKMTNLGTAWGPERRGNIYLTKQDKVYFQGLPCGWPLLSARGFKWPPGAPAGRF